MRLACIGSNIESEYCLLAFIERGLAIDLVITRPENNSRNISDYVNLHPLCRKHEIAVISTTNVNSDETILKVKTLGLDVLLTLGWSQLFRTDFRSCFKFVVGSHPTLLPRGMGRAPIPWTILNKLEESAVSFFLIDEGVDSGDLILQKKFVIDYPFSATELYAVVAKYLSEGFIQIIEDLQTNGKFSLEKIKVNYMESYHTAKRTLVDGILDFKNPAEDIELLVRAVTHPYPGAYSYYQSRRLHFFSARVESSRDYYGSPGQILEVNDSEIRIACKNGSVWLGSIIDDSGSNVDTNFFKLHEKLGYHYEDEIHELKKELKILKEKFYDFRK